MTKILIALDYGPGAREVVEAGFSVGKAMNAEIILLHVMPDPVYYASSGYSPVMGFGGYLNMDFLQPGVINQIRDTSLDFLEKTKLHLGDTTIQTMVKEGSVHESILETALELQAGIIVIGSHSRRWLENILLGTVAEKLLQHSTVPLFIVPVKKLL
jgi:nucleotide-binding universal stress UspA family protein